MLSSLWCIDNIFHQKGTNRRWPMLCPARRSLCLWRLLFWMDLAPRMTKAESATCGPEMIPAPLPAWVRPRPPAIKTRGSSASNICSASNVLVGELCSLLFRQDVLNSSDHQAVLFLANLVEGKYSFRLTVTDSKGQSSTSRGTVEVKPGMETTPNMDASRSHSPCSRQHLTWFCPVGIRSIRTWPGGAGVGGDCIPDLPAPAWHAPEADWRSPGRAGQRHRCEGDRCF